MPQKCDNVKHTVHSAVAVVVMVAYCIGYPVYIGVRLLLHHRRGTLHDRQTRKTYKFLSNGAQSLGHV